VTISLASPKAFSMEFLEALRRFIVLFSGLNKGVNKNNIRVNFFKEYSTISAIS
jgi:hypothetical protein